MTPPDDPDRIELPEAWDTPDPCCVSGTIVFSEEESERLAKALAPWLPPSPEMS